MVRTRKRNGKCAIAPRQCTHDGAELRVTLSPKVVWPSRLTEGNVSHAPRAQDEGRLRNPQRGMLDARQSWL